jgi:hypothetical protein
VFKNTPREPAADAKARKKAVRTIVKAAERLGLDIKQPADWERLHDILLGGDLDRPSRIGRPPRWDRGALFALGADLWCFLEGGRRMLGMGDATALIRKTLPHRYQYDSPRAIYRRLTEAQLIVERDGAKERVGTRYGDIDLLRDQKGDTVRINFSALQIDFGNPDGFQIKLTLDEIRQFEAALLRLSQ